MGERFATAELESPLGRLRVAASGSGLVRVALPRDRDFSGWLARKLPDGERVERVAALDGALEELTAYFEGRLTRFGVALDLRGTEFQRAVWRALREIPFGETRSYLDVARAVGNPRAVRAVGGANGANPIPIVVPCHRVIAADGGIGGYSGGLDVKRRLLALERERRPSHLL